MSGQFTVKVNDNGETVFCNDWESMVSYLILKNNVHLCLSMVLLVLQMDLEFPLDFDVNGDQVGVNE
tara:strand:- start:1655 stop:1855 length:201 start_codon:yes stop_codon:yes gene_type:complete